MAKVAEQNLVIRISKLVRNNESESLNVLDEDTIASIQEVVVQLLSEPGIVVEIEKL